MSAYASIACPHCHQRPRVRSSRKVDALVRELHLVCLNDDCGHRFGAQIVITHTIFPSMAPNPDVHLRMTPPPMLRAGCIRAANEDQPAPGPAIANDNDALRAQLAAGDSAQRRTAGGPEVPPVAAANDDDSLAEAVAIGS